ncbi:MinD/ParA family protein [Bacillus daqingensis]|uniref:MinD/ParA family protein n=1 Tax=Bacillus daqingensis TaxID=872396 RepID=A0ABV9NQD9_9BACI
MNDQAYMLRERMRMQRQSTAKPVRTTAICSGKGGVGKSNMSVNLGLEYVNRGEKVLLMDLDIGMANVHLLLGTEAKGSIVKMLDDELAIQEVISCHDSGLHFISGGSALKKLFSLDEAKQHRFNQQLEKLEGMYDRFIFDLGAGITFESLQFLKAADDVLLVTTPEPTSVTDAYAVLKFISQLEEARPVSILVNRASTEKEGKRTADSLRHAALKFLAFPVAFAGSIPDDAAVAKAVKTQLPFILHAPATKASKAVKQAADTLAGEKKQTSSSFTERLKTFFLRGERP